VAFTVTENLGADCPGIWSVDGEGEYRWLAAHKRSPVFPSFQHDGRLAFGLFTDRDYLAYPLIDIVGLEDGKLLARGVLFLGFTWSPAREQLLALTAKPGRKRLSLVLVEPEHGRTTTVTDAAGGSFAWLGGDGDMIAFLKVEDGQESLWVADPDGTHARRLTRGVHERFAASLDGKRIAFRRSAAGSRFTDELWVVDVERGDERRVPGVLLPDRSGPDVWTGERTLVVHDDDDAVLVDVQSGQRSLLAQDVLVLQLSPDGSRLLAIRKHVLGADREQEVIAVLTMRPDGTDEQLLAVTDAELGNIHGIPVFQPVAHELIPADELTAPPGKKQRCRSKLIALRERVDKLNP